MSKGNSGLLTKHQSKNDYTEVGSIGSTIEYEVLTEVVIRLSTMGALPTNSVRVCGRIANDSKWHELGTVIGPCSEIFHIASWDYVMFDCTTFSSVSGTNTLTTSAFFNDGMFMINAINDMSDKLNKSIFDMHSEICDIKESINTLHRQIEIITDYEECEVK